MNENFNETTLLFIICIPPILLYMVSVFRRVYIYRHPPKEIGKLYSFCDFSARRKQSIIIFILLILFSLFQNIAAPRIEFILLDIVALLSLLSCFLKDRIFENGISYNNIYILTNEIEEIIYKKSREEYWIKTRFPTPARMYVKIAEGMEWPEYLLNLITLEEET
ncbi:hypothetical protein [Frisingicoccus sp.]|uniref:hypothetical protein n=1 Tax=Frisingicoccus sp. TaxID=1918627 RepID=UPI0015B2246A